MEQGQKGDAQRPRVNKKVGTAKVPKQFSLRKACACPGPNFCDSSGKCDGKCSAGQGRG